MAKSRSGVFKRILKQLKGYRIMLALTVLCALVSVAGTLAVPVFFGRVINLIDETREIMLPEIFKNFIIIGVLIAVTCVSQWLMNIINNRIAYCVVRDIRQEMFSKIQRLPLKFLDGNSVGDIVGRSIADAETFSDGLLMGFTQFFTGVLTICGTLGIMIYYNYIIAIIVFVLTPLSFFVAKFIASKTYALFKRTSEIRGGQTAFIDETVGNLKVVRAFNREDECLEKFDEINENLTRASLKSIFYSSLTNPCTRFINAIIYAAVALAGSLMLVSGFSLPVVFNVGVLTIMLSYANQYTKPFNEISEVITELQNAIACAGRIYEVIDEPAEKPDAPDAVTLQNAEGNISFDGVYFSYVEDKKLIQNLNVLAKAGQRVAIVGPTGCGKTTMINLLMRFYEPTDGRISVDGKDILSVTRKSLRQSYGMVLQDTWLKSGTVRENIAMGKPDARDGEIIAAAKAAHAHNFIMQLPQGYNTVLGEDGTLSQGQKQLLCIARIMLCLPPMLILDEATSSIDTRTELKIQEAFATLMRGRTSFIVAHRLSTVKEADVILVMKDGNIIEQGTHTELLNKNGFYSELYNSQFAI